MAFDPFRSFRRRSASRRDQTAPSPSSRPGGGTSAPATAQRVPWHRRPAWTRAARGLLRHYSRRSDYRLVIKADQKQPLAAVNHESKTVEVTTAFPKAGAETAFNIGANSQVGIRAARFLRQRPTAFWLHGFLAHEAGHILYSNGKPEPATLGWLWNSLEDERMERLVAKKYPKVGPIFDGMGDVMLSETAEQMSARHQAQEEARRRSSQTSTDVLKACLSWRWLHDHALPSESYHPYLRLPQESFEDLRPLIEEAWEVSSSDEVTEIAREILNLFDIDEERSVSEELRKFDLQGGESASGASRPGPGADEGPESAGENGSEDPEEESHGDGTGGSGDEDSTDEEEEGEESRRGNADSDEPDFPDYDPASEAGQAGGSLLEGLTSDVRALSQVLRPPAESRTRMPHRSRGRFSYRRHVSGAERVYRQRRRKNAPPAYVTVLIDLSGSMRSLADKKDRSGSTLLDHAKRATALISGAAEIAGTDMRVIPFRQAAGEPIESDRTGHERLRAALSTAKADDRTRLGPALRKALGTNPAPRHGRHLVALISDGQLKERDVERSTEIYRRARRKNGNVLVLPLLIGAALKSRGSGPSSMENYQAIFGRYADVTDPADLPDVVRRWLNAYA